MAVAVQLCDIFILEITFQVVKWAFPNPELSFCLS